VRETGRFMDEKNIMLCHKCDGILDGDAHNTLYGCECISGWVRDWQEPISLKQAIQQQIAGTEQRLQMYRDQKRADDWIQSAIDRLVRLKFLPHPAVD